VTEVSRVPTPSGSLIDQLGAPRAEPLRDGTPPDDRSLARILETATTVPDHGSLRPWRFAVIIGAGRERFAEALVESLHELRGNDLPDAVVAKMRGKAFAAPCAVVLIASPNPESNVPEWEQVASASCTGYALVLAATALGFGAVWKSAAVLDGTPIRALFELAHSERLLGWINLGTPGALGRKKQSDGEVADRGPLVTTLDSADRGPG
jgi:nitroreductase